MRHIYIHMRSKVLCVSAYNLLHVIITSSFHDNTSQCNQSDSNPGWCRPNINTLLCYLHLQVDVLNSGCHLYVNLS